MNTSNSKRQLFSIVLLYGSIWGILEATVGYVLHWLPALISGSVMFPIALLILRHGYLQTNSRKAVFLMGVVAATIKGVNLFMPNLTIWKAINPMVAILIEAALASVVVHAFTKERLLKTALLVGAVSIGWKVAFVLYQVGNGLLIGAFAPYLQSVRGLVEFVLVQGTLSWIFALTLLHVGSKAGRWNPVRVFRPVFAASSFLLAVLATILIR
jgi:hypothetical protein